MPYTRELGRELGSAGSPMENFKGFVRKRPVGCKMQGVVSLITAIVAIETGKLGKISR